MSKQTRILTSNLKEARVAWIGHALALEDVDASGCATDGRHVIVGVAKLHVRVLERIATAYG